MGDLIVLPRVNKDGKPRISYSQIKAFKEKESFNLKIEGKLEYMIEYFMGHKFPDAGWGEFGHDVEAYIGKKEGKEKFDIEERKTLDKIKPLGVLGDKVEIDFGEFVLMMVVDDRLDDWSHIVDYKTASKNSSKKYYEEDYKQLDIYALKPFLESGMIPKLTVKVIERKGNCMFKGGRELLKVGKEIWEIPRETNEDRLNRIKSEIYSVVIEISDLYKEYLKLNTKK